MADEAFSIDHIKSLAENFAAEHLSDFTNHIKSPECVFSRKEINDPIWGTIGLAPVEVALLDSPLIQRLRTIRQLGVVHWVYPGAVHARFEHSLGVLHQVQNLISALNTLASQRDLGLLIDKNYSAILRLCALLHDVGHAAFSHVSEMALESLPEINPVAAAFSRAQKVEERKFSEIFAFYIIKSTAMREFLSALLDRYDFVTLSTDRTRNLDLLVEKLAAPIIGIKIHDKVPLLHEIISGPFDADKLDYFSRDAKLAGTPTVMDISRLVQKISIRDLDLADLPDEIARNVNKIDSKYLIFGIRWSGVPVLDELQLARVLLHAKIYRHPKVIAIEQMLRAAIVTMASFAPVEKILGLFYANDDNSILGMTEEALAEALSVKLPIDDEQVRERLSCAAKLLRDIKERRLWVKAFQIQRRYPNDPSEKSKVQSIGQTDFREEVEHPQQREQFRQALLDEVEKIVYIVHGTNAPSRTKLDASIMIHTMGQTPGGSQIARAYLLPSTGKPMPFREYQVNRAAWADSYMSDQPSGYVVAAYELANAVYLGVEKLIRLKHGVRLPESALEASKRDFDNIQALKRRLSLRGYYKDAPFDIRPRPERLKRADVVTRVDSFSSRVSVYQAPHNDRDESSKQSSKERTYNWLRQFDNDDHVECALTILDKFRMIGRSDTVEALKTFIGKNPEFQGSRVVPFGSAKDSSAIHTYFSADLLGSYVSGCCTLEEACKAGTRAPIIFIDDFIGSGGQAQDILAAGFGMQSARRDLGEQRDMFVEDVQKYLRSTKVGFVFTAGWDEGITTVEKMAKTLKLDAKVSRHLGEDDIPFAFSKDGEDNPAVTEEPFGQFCMEVGASLVTHALELKGQKESKERTKKIEERKLGYGNRGMLLASPFNVPTQTLTLIWASGKVGGVDWSPLLPRREKK